MGGTKSDAEVFCTGVPCHDSPCDPGAVDFCMTYLQWSLTACVGFVIVAVYSPPGFRCRS